MSLQTSLNDIRSAKPCSNGWHKLLLHVGKTHPDAEPIEFQTILNSNGPMDTIWCLKALPDSEHLCRLFAICFALKSNNVLEQDLCKNAISVAFLYSLGLLSEDSLLEARRKIEERDVITKEFLKVKELTLLILSLDILKDFYPLILTITQVRFADAEFQRAASYEVFNAVESEANDLLLQVIACDNAEKACTLLRSKINKQLNII